MTRLPAGPGYGRFAAAFGTLVAILALVACGAAHGSPGGANGGPGSQADNSRAPGSQTRAPQVNMGRLINPVGKYFGVQADGAPESLAPVQRFAALSGRQPDLIGQYVGWNEPFDVSAARTAWSYGALYYVVWEPFDTTVAAIANSASNGYITRFADQIKATGVPVALSFGHEMNGNWYPWGTTGATPASFVAAWRLIHALFAAAGATNVIWIWNPNVISAANVPLSPYYPGDSYVDWIGLTGYFPMTGPTTFSQLFGPTMAEVRQFTRKPFIVVETAVQTGANQVACVRSLVHAVQHLHDVLGFVWFEYNKSGVNWSLQSRPLVRAALASAIARLKTVDVVGQ